MDSKGACKECGQDQFPSKAASIGENVNIMISVGRGHSNTNHSFYQCENCGSVWMVITDSGAGGHGRFPHRLTKKTF